MHSIPGRFGATTVSAGAIALLLLSLPSQSVDTEPVVDTARAERLQLLLAEHDVRYALRTYAKAPTDCQHSDVESGK